jgi:hypothetical protein
VFILRNKLSFFLRLAGLAAAWSTVFACSASLPTSPDPTASALLIIGSALNNVRPLGEHALRAYKVDSDGVFQDVTTAARWESSDPGLLRVTQSVNGVTIGGLGISGGSRSGDATITASYQGRTDSITVTVLPNTRPSPYLELTISPGQPLTLDLRSPATIRFRYFRIGNTFQEVNGLVTVTTSDPSVATIEGNRIVPVSPGHFYILTSYEGVSERTLMFVAPSTALPKP